MKIKMLLFCLFLYTCLVWIFVAYNDSGSRVGLLWTAGGIFAVLLLVIGFHVLGWWRSRRARNAAQPGPVPPPIPAQTPVQGDSGVAALLAEVNAALAKSPTFAGKKIPLSGMPFYLLIGPDGGGKTTTFQNSGLEPQLLAGQGAATAAIPNRISNLWLARNVIFIEVSGKAFNGDPGEWTLLLSGLRMDRPLPWWRLLWQEPPSGMQLRGVIGFCDVKEFSGASADPQRFERYSRDWQQRLRAIGDVFGMEFPVYHVITKCDSIPYFPEFFRRLPEAEAQQVFGCTLPPHNFDSASSTAEASGEAESKRLTESFRRLYYSLAGRRLVHLAHEPDATQRPAIYEFPRELKRIRSPIVQFLTDAFRPHPLRPGPLLRGYYFSAVREVEAGAVDPGAATGGWAGGAGMDATRLFRFDATQLMRPDDLKRNLASMARGGPMVQRWMFLSDLFHSVIFSDRPQQARPTANPRLELYRRLGFAALCVLAFLLCSAFAVSWRKNIGLLQDVQEVAAIGIQKHRNPATVDDLQVLENLRAQIERLQQGAGLSYHWGLYSADRVLPAARRVYFSRFQQLLLNDLNGSMVQRLKTLPSVAMAGEAENRAYRTLKAHLIISTGVCKPDTALVSQVLNETGVDLTPASARWQELAGRQIDFYAAALGHGNPCPLEPDSTAINRAREYLSGSPLAIYNAILADAAKSVAGPPRLADLAPDYSRVLAAPGDINPVFSRNGWAFVQKASTERKAPAADDCVLGGSLRDRFRPGVDIAQQIQQRYIHDYIVAWQQYVGAFSVRRYANAEDGGQKLEMLSARKSPLLAVFALTASQTDFPAATPAAGLMEKTVEKGKSIVKKWFQSKAPKQVPLPSEQPPAPTPFDITQAFQPVHTVVPPASDPWGTDKTTAYTDALAELGRSLGEIGGGAKDPAVYQTASQSAAKAYGAARQLAKPFKSVEVAAAVERLLNQPIKLAETVIIVPNRGDPINKGLAALCRQLSVTLQKFPFQKSDKDVTLPELNGLFAPNSGAIWKFAGTLIEFAVKDGTQWRPKDPAQQPQVTGEMLEFLNRAQAITDAFYPAGSTQPRLSYVLRPQLDPQFGDTVLEFEVDGQLHTWTSRLQHQFNWPGAGRQKSYARLKTGPVAYPFATRDGLWGIFRIMAAAEPRELGSKQVSWKYADGGDSIKPGPVHIEIVRQSGEPDVFNPKFWELKCPAKAVQ